MSAGRYKLTLHAGEETVTLKLRSVIGDIDGLISDLRDLALSAEVVHHLAMLVAPESGPSPTLVALPTHPDGGTCKLTHPRGSKMGTCPCDGPRDCPGLP